MSIKTTGAEFKRFYNDDAVWKAKGDAWFDDVGFDVDGLLYPDHLELTDIPDTATVQFTGGSFYPTQDGREGEDFERVFRRWRKAQTTVTFTVDCPKDKEATVRAAIEAAGAKAGK